MILNNFFFSARKKVDGTLSPAAVSEEIGLGYSELKIVTKKT
jgi:hypothetical protein